MKTVITMLAAMLFGFASLADVTISGQTSIDYAVGGGGAAVKMAGSGSWTATVDVDWITLVKSSGDAGQSCTYIVTRNNNADPREGHISISGNIYTVTQQGCTVELSSTSASITKLGGGGTITASIDAGVAWTAEVSDSWITISPTSGSGAAEISYSVAEYNVVGSRIGTIRIGSAIFTINQTGIDVTISPVSTNVTKDVCVVPIQVVAMMETKWTVTPNVSWISVLDSGNGYGGSQVTIAVAENPSFEKRTGTVSIGSAIFTVAQSGTDDVNFKILPEVATASPKGAFANVAVYATPDATWSAESEDEWIKITEGSDGAGNGNVKYVTMSNPELVARTGHIKFTPPAYEPDFDLYCGLVYWGHQELGRGFASWWDADKGKDVYIGCDYDRDSDDYTLSFTVRFSELNILHRMGMIGVDSLIVNENNHFEYAGVDTGFSIDQTGVDYTFVFRIDDSHNMTIYAGEADTLLRKVVELQLDNYLEYSESNYHEIIVTLKYSDYPSTGYLQYGSIGNLRFWTRALADIECQNIDTRAYEMLDGKLLSAPNDAEYWYFPMNGNILASNGEKWGPYDFSPKVKCDMYGFDNLNRNRQRLRSFRSWEWHTGYHTYFDISGAEKLFTGESILNNGYDLTKYNYSYCQSINGGNKAYYYPKAAKVKDNSDCDASYLMWILFESIPEDGRRTILRREVSPTEDAGGKTVGNNTSILIEIGCDHKIHISGTGISDTALTPFISTNKWYHLAVVGKSAQTINFYLDGQDVGNINSSMSLGYVPAVDCRYAEYDCYGYHTATEGSVVEVGVKFLIGCESNGWDGLLDDFTLCKKALSQSEIREIYNANPPLEDVYHTVNQGIQEPTISPEEISIGKSGVTTNIELSVARTINWTAVVNDNWLSIVANTSGTGPATIAVKIDPNTTCLPRTGSATIGTKTLTITQEGLQCEICADKTIFPTEADETGGMGVISVTPEGNGSWTVSSDVDWIYCYPDSGYGSSDVYFFVEDMGSTAASRSGIITIGGQTIEITQRGYELSIDPAIAEVGGNAGAGIIGVAADSDAIWEAIADVPWITIVQTTDKQVRYTFTDNTTGQTRIGHINIAGEQYTLTQTCKLDLNTTVVGQGTVTGGGKYAQGVKVELTATPASGYEFSHWSGDMVGTEASGSIIMDTVKNVTATFIPETAAQVLVEKKAAQGGFYTRDQIHNLELGNLVLDVDSTTGKARIGVQLQETSDLSNPDWQPVNVTSGDVDIGSDGTVGIKASATGNAKFFRVVTPNK